MTSGPTTQTIPDAGRQVRSIVPEDEPGLLDLWRETWTATYRPSLGAEALQSMLRGLDGGAAAMLAGRGERGYVLVQGHRIVGSAIAREHGGTAYLWGMYVRPARQRSGAGSALLVAVARDLVTAVSLEVRVLSTSEPAQAFYRSRGFQPIGEETTQVMDRVDVPTLVLGVDVARLRAILG